jgi:hypothetical protein
MTRESERLYVYALAAPGLPPHFTVLGHRLRSLPLGDVAVVVERRPAPDFTADAVRQQHEIVTRLASRATAILPARFGSVTDDASLRSLVARRRSDIVAALEQVRGCVQMTIRIFGSTGEVPDDRASGARTGTEFLEGRRERARRVPPEVEVVRRHLGAHVKAERVAAGEREGLLTVFHLILQSAVDDYRRHSSGVASTLRARAVTVTGPWPAFAFAPELF